MREVVNRWGVEGETDGQTGRWEGDRVKLLTLPPSVHPSVFANSHMSALTFILHSRQS